MIRGLRTKPGVFSCRGGRDVYRERADCSKCCARSREFAAANFLACIGANKCYRNEIKPAVYARAVVSPNGMRTPTPPQKFAADTRQLRKYAPGRGNAAHARILPRKAKLLSERASERAELHDDGGDAGCNRDAFQEEADEPCRGISRCELSRNKLLTSPVAHVISLRV